MNVSGGSINHNLYANDTSQINVSSGVINTLNVYDRSQANISGGSITDSLFVSDNAQANFSGGMVSNGFFVNGSGQANVSGGVITDSLYVNGSGKINLTGGSISDALYANGDGQFNISGGTVSQYLFANGNSKITISGGMFGQQDGVNFLDSTTGGFTLIGSDIKATNARANATLGGTDYDLSGTLLDGTNINGYVLNVQNGANYTLASVPEPAFYAMSSLLALGGSGLLVRRRKARAC